MVILNLRMVSVIQKFLRHKPKRGARRSKFGSNNKKGQAEVQVKQGNHDQNRIEKRVGEVAICSVTKLTVLSSILISRRSFSSGGAYQPHL